MDQIHKSISCSAALISSEICFATTPENVGNGYVFQAQSGCTQGYISPVGKLKARVLRAYFTRLKLKDGNDSLNCQVADMKGEVGPNK